MLILLAATLLAQPPAMPQDSGAFLITIGTDTIGVDRFTRSRDALRGEFVMRFPRTTIIRYELTFDHEGQPGRFSYGAVGLDGRPLQPDREVRLAFAGDSVEVATDGPSVPVGRFPAAHGTVPLLLPFLSYALFSEAVRIGLATPATNGAHPFRVFPQGGRSGFAVQMMRAGSTVRVSYAFGTTLVAQLDPEGRVVAWDGTASVLRALAPRVAWSATRHLAAEWIARDQRGAALGPLSVRDTARGEAGGARITVDYSSPRLRGRAILGRVVPFGQIWRAGADAATQLELSSDLMVGGQRLAAGRYTLWILPHDSTRATLIVNGQVGQWGTDYNPGRDVLRVPMSPSHGGERREALAYAITESALILAWDATRWSVRLGSPPTGR